MPEVVVANDDLVVIGGPSSIQLKLDVGATGTRGSYIYTDTGKPTSNQITLSPPPLVGDLFINVNPSDNEYLYLYQYKLVNAVLTWTKVLRLVPNTVLLNPYFKFINGEAYSPVVKDGYLAFVKGLFFTLAGAGSENQELEGIDPRDLNVHYRVTGESQVMSNLKIESVGSTFANVEYIVALTGDEEVEESLQLNSSFVRASLTAAELNTETMEIELVNGYRMVDFLATIGGRSEQVIDIASVEVASLNPADAITILVNGTPTTVPFPGALIIPNNSLEYGDKIVYLSYGNTPITGIVDNLPYPLVNGQEYFVAYVDDDAVVISTPDMADLIAFATTTMSGTHAVIDLGGISV